MVFKTGFATLEEAWGNSASMHQLYKQQKRSAAMTVPAPLNTMSFEKYTDNEAPMRITAIHDKVRNEAHKGVHEGYTGAHGAHKGVHEGFTSCINGAHKGVREGFTSCRNGAHKGVREGFSGDHDEDRYGDHYEDQGEDHNDDHDEDRYGNYGEARKKHGDQYGDHDKGHRHMNSTDFTREKENQYTNIALYVFSGIVLIFVMEQFIQIGINMKST
jgi:hypothetical protein